MALTEPEARVLGALSGIELPGAKTVRELSDSTGLTEGSTRKALMRLSRTGLALGTRQGLARWRPTDRGRLTIKLPAYSEYGADQK